MGKYQKHLTNFDNNGNITFAEGGVYMIKGTLKLLPQQVEALKKEVEGLNAQYLKLVEDAKNEDKFNVSCDSQGITDVIDHSTTEKLSYISRRVKEISNCLKCHELVTEYSKDSIQIGTEFEVFMKFSEDDKEQGTYRLVDDTIGFSYEDNCVSVNSPLGAAAHNKKVGDQFSYKIPAGTNVDCVILDILPEKTIDKAKQKVLK